MSDLHSPPGRPCGRPFSWLFEGFPSMKRMLLVAAAIVSFVGGASAQMPPAPPSMQAVVLASEVPAVAECRGTRTQAIFDRASQAQSDPAEDFENNRRAHPHMLMMPAPVACASKLYRALHRRRLLSSAKAPTGTD